MSSKRLRAGIILPPTIDIRQSLVLSRLSVQTGGRCRGAKALKSLMRWIDSDVAETVSAQSRQRNAQRTVKDGRNPL